MSVLTCFVRRCIKFLMSTLPLPSKEQTVHHRVFWGNCRSGVALPQIKFRENLCFHTGTFWVFVNRYIPQKKEKKKRMFCAGRFWHDVNLWGRYLVLFAAHITSSAAVMKWRFVTYKGSSICFRKENMVRATCVFWGT